jgi:threonine dehydrogenase-like Zn-dependent dehydrogenase
MNARVYVLQEFNKPLVEQSIPIPELLPGQVLVKLKASGVCGSDLHMWKGEDSRTRLPMILGHEGIGTVAGIGGKKCAADGSELREGDLVFWNRGISCGYCYYCAVLKEPSFCQNRKVPGINVPMGVPPYLNGCYADHVILDAGTNILKVPQTAIDPSVLVAASCSGATAAHGFDIVRPNLGETVVIFGPGPIGLFSAAYAKKYGAGEIVLIGGSEVRLEMGSQFGATTLLNRKKLTAAERQERIMELTSGRGADLIIEASGSGDALREAIGLARMGGTVLSVGLSQPGGTFEFDGFKDLTRRNLRLQGVWVSDTRHAYQAMNLVFSDPELFSRLVTHRFPLSEVNQALQVMDSREAIKAVLLPELG